MLTSVFGGFATFAIVGYMAAELQLPIDNVATHGNSDKFHLLTYHTAVSLSLLWNGV